MSQSTTPRAPRPYSPDAIDTEPLQGRGRNEFEAGLFTRVKRSQQLVLRIILGYAAGKADCWPGNKRIAETAGYQVRNIQIILRALEKAQIIRCVVDRSLKTQRRIVILDHPHAVMVLDRLGDRPWMHQGAQKSAPKPAKTAQPGAQKPVQPGMQIPVGSGAQDRPAKSSSIPKPEIRIPGFSLPSERPKPRNRAEQLAWIEAQIAARATDTIQPIDMCRT